MEIRKASVQDLDQIMQIYEKAREYIGDTNEKVVFDLYSGTGTIAQILAPVAKKVVGVEIVEEAVEAAKVNAKLNGLDNCTFIAGDVLKAIDLVEFDNKYYRHDIGKAIDEA